MSSCILFTLVYIRGATGAAPHGNYIKRANAGEIELPPAILSLTKKMAGPKRQTNYCSSCFKLVILAKRPFMENWFNYLIDTLFY